MILKIILFLLLFWPLYLSLKLCMKLLEGKYTTPMVQTLMVLFKFPKWLVRVLALLLLAIFLSIGLIIAIMELPY
jgi:hypothetical protein